MSLQLLAQYGWIATKWGISENNRRAKLYSITRSGSKQLARETEDCERISGIIGSLLAFAGQAHQRISPEARSTRHSQIGNTVLLKQMRLEMSFSTVEALRQDVRFGLRTLRRSPGFAAVAVLTLALGIGANAAIFSVVKAVLLDPLPYAHADRLVIIGEPLADDPDNPLVPYTAMREIAARSQCLERVSAYGDGPAMLMENDRPEMLRGLSVDSNFFDTIGAQVALGRNFLPSEQQPNQRLAIILSHSLWVRRFGGDPHILGRQLHVSRGPVTVVGILPPAFLPLLKATSTSVPEMYYPQAVDPFATCRDCQRLRFLGRLKRGVTLERATVELNGIFAAMRRESPESYPLGVRISLVALPDSLIGRARTALWAVWCAAGFVLLVACANVANLLMARSAGRTGEIALRTALGAGRRRLIRQLLTESLVLATSGGVLGTALALLGTGALASLAPDGIPRAQSAHVDTTVLGVACAATVLAGLLFGMAPAWRASQVNLARAIKGAGEGGLTHNGLRNAFTIAEIALAFVLAVGAGLMVRTFWRLMTVGAGFDPNNVLTLTTSVNGPRYAGNLIGYYQEVLERLRAAPGIAGAAMTSRIPMDYTERLRLLIDEHPLPDRTYAPWADQFSVSTDYFEVMRIPLKRGRLFSEQDTATTPRVALINEACARAQFAGENPIGKHIQLGGPPWMTIVGIVGDVHQDGIDRPVDLQVYMPLNQEAIVGYYRLMARTTGDPIRLEHAIRSVFETVDPGSPVYHVKPLGGYYSERLANRTFALALLGLLGGLAVTLAAVGIYGVISYSVTQRTREVGIRMALGAGRRDVLMLVLWQALPLIGAGLGIGFAASLWLTRLLGTLLFEVAPVDPATSIAVAVLLGSVAIAAATLPARHAATIDPMAALRRE
jgi:putative ABC transport system permease protein